MLKGQNGITLVALVITIVVLLILAAVTINLTLGENGLFSTAQSAVENYSSAQDKEIQDMEDLTNNKIPTYIQNVVH